MTLTELQNSGKKWGKRPDRSWNEKEAWNIYLAKNKLRLVVELANSGGVTLEQLAKELIDELA